MAPPATVGISPSSLNHAFRDPPPTEAPAAQAVLPLQDSTVTQQQAAVVAEEPAQFVKAAEGPTKYSETFISGPKNFKADVEIKGSETQPAARYKHYLPTWDATKKYAPLQPFEHYEHGKDADPTFPNLLKGAAVDELTGNTGAEVKGIQLSQLTNAGKDELALFVAKHKVVAFRDQDFADLPIKEAVDFVGYFGRHHIHPTSGAPEGFPEVHLVHRGAEDESARKFFEENATSVRIHSDVTYEQQPPGTTFLYLLDGPPSGGDTLFVNQVEAYKRLSPAFQQRLHGLTAIHSAVEQAQASSNRGGIVRREPVQSEHPIVRTHPATGEKALFVNPQFTRRIVGLKKEESDYLLKFLYDHIALSADVHARVRWAKGTVVVWDNRVTAHSALLDWDNGVRRHLARLQPQAERPVETAWEKQ